MRKTKNRTTALCIGLIILLLLIALLFMQVEGSRIWATKNRLTKKRALAFA